MSRVGRPRLHTHLSREAIAQAGLGIIDGHGLDALSLRSVAAALGVGVMTLYQHVPDREAMEKDIIALLLAEVDTAEKPGETWDESIRRVGRSLREMTLGHPHAFTLVATAPTDEPPVLDYAERITRLHAGQGIPQSVFVQMWSVVDAFLTGFMLMLAQSVTRAQGELVAPTDAATGGLSADLSGALSSDAFERDLDVVIAGLRAVVTQEGGVPPG
jgi:AcrR family transcriptional regulator